MAERIAHNVKLEISANGMVWKDITRSLRELNAPNYGHDKYHNARLIGAYHAHRAFGGEVFAKWRQSLCLPDRIYVNAYESLGEWGRTDLNVFANDKVTMVGAALGASVAFSGLATAMAKMSENMRAAGAGFADDIWDGVSKMDFIFCPDSVVIIERIKLRCWLESIYVPSAVACWVAGNLPAWALPAVLYYRLKRFSNAP